MSCVARVNPTPSSPAASISLAIRSSDPTTQLVQLCQSELVGPFDDDGVGIRHIDTGFNDGAADQNVQLSVVEIVHHRFELSFRHLTMANTNPYLREHFSELCSALINRAYFVM